MCLGDCVFVIACDGECGFLWIHAFMSMDVSESEGMRVSVSLYV